MYVSSHPLQFSDLFFFNDTATTEIYTLSLHDALPISPRTGCHSRRPPDAADERRGAVRPAGGRTAAFGGARAVPFRGRVAAGRARQYAGGAGAGAGQASRAGGAGAADSRVWSRGLGGRAGGRLL